PSPRPRTKPSPSPSSTSSPAPRPFPTPAPSWPNPSSPASTTAPRKVLFHELRTDGDAEAGTGGDGDAAGSDGERLLAEVVEHRVEAEGVFQDRAVRGGCGEVEAGGEEQRRAPEVGRHEQLVGGGERRDAHPFADPARDGEV